MRRLFLTIVCLVAAASFVADKPAGGHADARSWAPTVERAGPVGRITFASDGRIYVVNVDGSNLQMIVDGSNAQQEGLELILRRPESAAAPAFSPDGTQVAFIRDLDVWLVNADGSEQRLLGDVANFAPSPGASNNTIGASSVAWSPDGTQIAYTLARVGGSGISGLGVVDVATSSVRRFRGRSIESPIFMAVSWLPDDSLSIVPGTEGIARIDPATGDELSLAPLQKTAPWPTMVGESEQGNWVAGSFVSEGAILYGAPGAMSQIAIGLSPTLSPDGEWVVYFKGETIRVVRTDGTDDREVLDLAPLGGRNRHFGSVEDCRPLHQGASCSYRAPTLSWAMP